ncbi:hypothetical protein HPY42_00230 [Coprothermobacteraceae bacterium]|nr:hypothetical protein [Coprothermobacteraceae bacterium]
MTLWLVTAAWAGAALVLGYWGLPSIVLVLFGSLAGYAWKDMAVEISMQADILKAQVEAFAKAPLVAVQALDAGARSAVAYRLVFFSAVSALSALVLFVAFLFFRVQRHSPRTMASTVLSILLGAICGFAFWGTLGTALQLTGYHLGIPDYALLQYLVSVLIRLLA